jgi:exonuclease SbcC
MKLTRIRLENIRSYENQEIFFPHGTTLLAGEVGAGKTTILMAIEFAFFGLQPGQRGASLVSNSKDDARVELEFELDDSPIIIERRLKRTQKGVNQEYSSISIGGVKEELSVSELKIRLLSLLGYPDEFLKKTNLLYRYTVYSPQEEMKHVITEDAESRLNSLRYVFGIEKYRKIKENAAKITLLLRERSKVLQGESKDIELFRSKLEADRKHIIILDKKISEAVKKLNEKRVFLTQKENELKKIEESISEKQKLEKEIEKANVALKVRLQQLSEYEMQLAQISEVEKEEPLFNEKHHAELSRLIEEDREKINSLEHDLIKCVAEISSLELKRKEDLIKNERVLHLDLCPTCLQLVSEEYKRMIFSETDKRVTDLGKKIQEMKTLKLKTESALKSIKEEIELLKQRRFELEMTRAKDTEKKLRESKRDDLRKRMESLKKDIKSLEDHATLLKEGNVALIKYESLNRLKKEEIQKERNEEKQIEILQAELKKEREIRLKDIDITSGEITRKESIRNEMVKLMDLESWLSNSFNGLIGFLERNILLRVRQEFSRKFNQWFRLLTTENFFAHLDESFTPIILQGNYETDYEFLSGGERTAVALAYRLALNQIINNVYGAIKTKDLLVLDEPTDGFSEQQLDRIREILPELKVEQILIVSHEQKIEGFVDNIIRIKKKESLSVVS